jgi:hypothetical protein
LAARERIWRNCRKVNDPRRSTVIIFSYSYVLWIVSLHFLYEQVTVLLLPSVHVLYKWVTEASGSTRDLTNTVRAVGGVILWHWPSKSVKWDRTRTRPEKVPGHDHHSYLSLTCGHCLHAQLFTRPFLFYTDVSHFVVRRLMSVREIFKKVNIFVEWLTLEK